MRSGSARPSASAPGSEQRAKLEQRLREALGKIADRDTKRAFGEDFRDRLASFSQRPKVYRSNSYSNHSTSPVSNRLLSGYSAGVGLSLREAILVGAIATAPRAALDRIEDLSGDSRLSPQALDLINKMVQAMMEAPDQAMTELLAATDRGYCRGSGGESKRRRCSAPYRGRRQRSGGRDHRFDHSPLKGNLMATYAWDAMSRPEKVEVIRAAALQGKSASVPIPTG